MNMKILDVGAGFYPYPGAVSIDGNAAAAPGILHDLNAYPWPVADSTYDMVYSSHCLEHLADPKRAVEEIWRVAKPGATVIIRVPHFSSRVAWTDIEHTRAFGIHSLRRFTPPFTQFGNNSAVFTPVNTRLRWQQRVDVPLIPGWARLLLPVINIANAVISACANISPEFCERLWCYYVGGMGEVEYTLRVEKP